MMQSTQLHHPRFALPPPAATRIVDGNRHVGWVSGGLLGFRGFDSEDQAMHAAWVVYRTIARRLAWRDGRRPMPVDIEEIGIRRGPMADRILAGGRPIATLIHPGSRSRSGPDGFGFELELPDSLDQASIQAKADLAYRTLRRSGVAWALWTRRPRELGTNEGGTNASRTNASAPESSRGHAVAPAAATALRDILALRQRPDRLEAVSILAIAAGLLGFVLLVAAVVIPRLLVAPLIAIGLAGVFGARLLSTPGPRARARGIDPSLPPGLVNAPGGASPLATDLPRR